MQRDPLGYVDGPNLYQYVGGNPGRYVDPFGLMTPRANGAMPGQVDLPNPGVKPPNTEGKKPVAVILITAGASLSEKLHAKNLAAQYRRQGYEVNIRVVKSAKDFKRWYEDDTVALLVFIGHGDPEEATIVIDEDDHYGDVNPTRMGRWKRGKRLVKIRFWACYQGKCGIYEKWVVIFGPNVDFWATHGRLTIRLVALLGLIESMGYNPFRLCPLF